MSQVQNELKTATTTHPFTVGNSLAPGDTDVQMLRINFNTAGMINTSALTTINIDAKGTDLTSVSSVKLYFTGDASSFTNPTLLGTITSGPVGDQYIFTINQNLLHGNNNF